MKWWWSWRKSNFHGKCDQSIVSRLQEKRNLRQTYYSSVQNVVSSSTWLQICDFKLCLHFWWPLCTTESEQKSVLQDTWSTLTPAECLFDFALCSQTNPVSSHKALYSSEKKQNDRIEPHPVMQCKRVSFLHAWQLCRHCTLSVARKQCTGQCMIGGAVHHAINLSEGEGHGGQI